MARKEKTTAETAVPVVEQPTPPTKMQQYAAEVAARKAAREQETTTRRAQVAALLAEGKKHREIAEATGLTPRQVAHHVWFIKREPPAAQQA